VLAGHGVKNEVAGERYEFDISKCGKIFDLLLQEKHILVSPNHVPLPPEELKNKKWCKVAQHPFILH
jgi:hypothetical protein